MAATDKISIIAAIYSLNTVDMSIKDLAFPAEFVHETQKVQFDRYDAGSEIALKGSFLDASNIVKKDGFEEITVNPMQVNEAIVDSPFNFAKRRIGETVNGVLVGLTAQEQARVEYEMKGFGKLKLRGERLLKKSMYDILVSGKVTVSKDGAPTDEIDYGLAAAGGVVVNGAGDRWNEATAYPVKQLIDESIEMGVYAYDTVVLGKSAYEAFIGNKNVLTTDNITTGQKANFRLATDAEAARNTDTFMLVGYTLGLKRIAVYVDLDQYNDGASDKYYLSEKYAVCFRAGDEMAGQVQYGAIPVAVKNGNDADIVAVVQREWMDAEIKADPAGVARYYRTSPLPTMNNPKKFKSIKTIA